jgi:hypothetical protein
LAKFRAGNRPISSYLKPPQGHPLESIAAHAESAERQLAFIITLASAENVRETRVAGSLVFRKPAVERV